MSVQEKSVAEMRKELAALQAKIDEKMNADRSAVVAIIREQVAEYTLTAEDIFPTTKGRKTPKQGTVAVKYRDPQNPQNQWTGRGKAPRWIADAPDRSIFAVNDAT